MLDLDAGLDLILGNEPNFRSVRHGGEIFQLRSS
jgi:hypothetical protein